MYQDRTPDSFSTSSSHVDIGIIVALREEYEVLIQSIDLHEVNEDNEKCPSITFGSIQINNKKLSIAIYLINDLGPSETISAVDTFLSYYIPRVAINIGISGALSDDSKLCDVIVASESDDYEYRGKITDKQGNPNVYNFHFGGRSNPTSFESESLVKLVKKSDEYEEFKYQYFSDIESAKQLLNEIELSELLFRDQNAVSIKYGSITAGNYVVASASFRDHLLTSRNRNFLAVDMESAAFLRQLRRKSIPGMWFIVIRGVSDLADPRKKKFDKTGKGLLRKIAMNTACRCLKLLLARIDFSSRFPTVLTSSLDDKVDLMKLERGLNDNIYQYVLPHRMSSINWDSTIADSYSKCLSYCISTMLSDKIGESLFDSIIDSINWNDPPCDLQITGVPGSGKTTFLAGLYKEIRRRRDEENYPAIPLYIDLHVFNDVGYGDASAQEIRVTDAVRAWYKQIQLITTTDSSIPLLIIIDGKDEYARFKEVVLDLLLVKQIHKPVQIRIVGTRSDSNKQKEQHAEGSKLHFEPLTVKSKKLEGFVCSFLTIRQIEQEALSTSAKALIKRIKKINLSEVDLFTLDLLIDLEAGLLGVKKDANYIKSEAQLIGAYIENELSKIRLGSISSRRYDETLLQEIAFSSYVKKVFDNYPQEVVAPFTDLVFRHSKITDYLVARRIIKNLVKVPSQSVGQLRKLDHTVYPVRVNRLVKQMLHDSPEMARKCLVGIKKIFTTKNLDIKILSTPAYVCGRIDVKGLRNDVVDILKKVLEKVEDKNSYFKITSEPHWRHLVRTIYISLASLDYEYYSFKYTDHLLSDHTADDLNRGFHLEYYGDLPYEPTMAMESTDLLFEYPETYRVLVNRFNKQNNPLFEIEIQTFASLAQHRHANGCLTPSIKEGTIHELVRIQNRVKNQRLRNYIHLVVEGLKDEKFSIGKTFNQYFYAIKSVRRTGWVKRGVANAESLCDHIMGTYLLARAFLPDFIDGEPEYRKSRVLELLLVHDLAEATTGDIPSNKKTEIDTHNEARVMSRMSLLGTYKAFANLSSIDDEYSEFESKRGINAIIAQDFDKIDQLVQLWNYRSNGHIFSDYDDWSNELMDKISHPRCREIVLSLKPHYDFKYKE